MRIKKLTLRERERMGGERLASDEKKGLRVTKREKKQC
jgi:hypothetical protein